MHEKKNALAGSQSPNSDPCEGLNPVENHARRIERLSRAKTRQQEMSAHLEEQKNLGSNENKHRAAVVQERMDSCGTYLIFRNYFTVDEIKLKRASFCKQFRTCPICAIQRAGKMTEAYVGRYEQVKQGWPELNAFFVTLTVKDGPDLMERLEHVQSCHKVLQQRMRDAKRGQASKSVWANVEGVLGAYEITKGANSGLWHPHAHLVVLAPSMPVDGDGRCRALEEEWRGITGDSYVVDVRPFDENQTATKSFCEVFKYVLKFSELSLADNWHAAEMMAGRRMTFSYGCLRGVKVPEELTDDDSELEYLPFVEMLYTYAVRVGYNLRSVSQAKTSAPMPSDFGDDDEPFDEFGEDPYPFSTPF